MAQENEGQHPDEQPQDEVQGLDDDSDYCFAPSPMAEEVTPDRNQGSACSDEEQVEERVPVMKATGPWFVLTPTQADPCSPQCGSLHEGGPNEQKYWNAIQFKNGNDADNKAIELVRHGHPFVYIGRALHRMEVPVQMTTLIEAMPNPQTQETE